MQSRTQRLIFLFIWAGAMVTLFITAIAYGFYVRGDMRAPLFFSCVLALAPAAAGYSLVLRCASVIDRWRVRRGHDLNLEREYVDDDGFTHLNEVPACERQEEVGLGEMVSGMGPALGRIVDDSDDQL
jgi:hypothetical protein